MAHHLGLTGSNLWNPIFSPSPSPLNCFEYSCTTLVPSDPEPTYSSSNASASPHHETCCISRNLACDQRAARHVAELEATVGLFPLHAMAWVFSNRPVHGLAVTPPPPPPASSLQLTRREFGGGAGPGRP